MDSSVLIFLTVFVPLYSREKNFWWSVEKALPLLFIAMCTYIANDLDDIERDKTNHPARPLPSRQLTTSYAAILYFISLTFALITAWQFVPATVVAWYYITLILAISYGYVVEWLPGFKALYVACALSLPILIVRAFYPLERRLSLVVLAVFLLSLGRELCKDLVDRAGDRVSFMHAIEPHRLATFAFAAQGIALLLLVPAATTLAWGVALLIMACVFSVAVYCWREPAKRGHAIYLMKLQLFAGLYFLI
jgi:geranylgeranylglycerol-phosphate geranylgeranyltransferase